MAVRNYTTIVTVTVISPDGNFLRQECDFVTRQIGTGTRLDFRSSVEADDFMKEEASLMLGAAIERISESFF